MLNYLDAKNALFTRGVTFTVEQYLFVAQTVLGEDAATAYAMVYDRQNFVKMTGTEDEQEYLQGFINDAKAMSEKMECKHLAELLNENYQSDVQASASTLQDYKFSGSDVQQLLANLLHNRAGTSDSLDDASVRDVISLVKMMYEQGALDSGDTFQRHFIQIHDTFNALCVQCNHEFEAYAGINAICPHCKQVYKWSEEERRFYPKFGKL